MGLLDSLESQVLGGGLPGGSNPIVSALLQMIQNQPGGLQGLVQMFHDKGLGDAVSSWVSTGQNLPVGAEQIHQALGSDQVKALAARAGISPDQAGSAIAQFLPGIVDKLTPNGEVPAHNSVVEMVGGLLQGFARAS